jgi:hypothetical protein
MSYTKILDSTTGSAIHTLLTKEVLQFVISGTPNANIAVFIQEVSTPNKNIARISFKCADWNGATLGVEYKTNHPEDAFNDTGHILSENGTETLEF